MVTGGGVSSALLKGVYCICVCY